MRITGLIIFLCIFIGLIIGCEAIKSGLASETQTKTDELKAVLSELKDLQEKQAKGEPVPPGKIAELTERSINLYNTIKEDVEKKSAGGMNWWQIILAYLIATFGRSFAEGLIGKMAGKTFDSKDLIRNLLGTPKKKS